MAKSTDGWPWDEDWGGDTDTDYLPIGESGPWDVPSDDPTTPMPISSDGGSIDDWLKDLESSYGVTRNEGDLADLQRRNPEDLDAVKREYEAQYGRRAASKAPNPAGDASGGDYGGGDGVGDNFDPGPFQGPIVKVGQDPFSKLLTGGYLDLLKNRGQTPFGKEMEGYLRDLLGNQGEIGGGDPALQAQRMEAARQPIEAFRRMQTNQGRAELANRGLISEPGQPQGAEMNFLANLDESLAPWYASAGQNLASDMATEKGQRFDRALALGTGFASQQAQDYLNALRGGSERQFGLSDIALQTLDRNMAWNQFLADFGLDRDVTLEQLQSGRQDDIDELLDMFQEYVNASQAGYR